ncbi:MAG: hypothetical protein ACKODT_07230 [Fluviibacter sp.]
MTTGLAIAAAGLLVFLMSLSIILNLAAIMASFAKLDRTLEDEEVEK